MEICEVTMTITGQSCFRLISIQLNYPNSTKNKNYLKNNGLAPLPVLDPIYLWSQCNIFIKKSFLNKII